jgi:hypothetical protein
MTDRSARILLVADSHLGFDLPSSPRVERRRRGDDFFACYQRALEPALRGEVDLVVHGGDVLYRSRVEAGLVERAFAPLKRIADRGTPVVVVPGNHERSAIPFPLLAAHPRIHVMREPRTLLLRAAGLDLALAGFPCERDAARAAFPALLARTRWNEPAAHVRLLCIHQAVEGATVGPSGFVFREGADVVLVPCDGKSEAQIAAEIRAALGRLDPDAVVRIALEAKKQWAACNGPSEARARELAPATMNVAVRRRVVGVDSAAERAQERGSRSCWTGARGGAKIASEDDP